MVSKSYGFKANRFRLCMHVVKVVNSCPIGRLPSYVIERSGWLVIVASNDFLVKICAGSDKPPTA